LFHSDDPNRDPNRIRPLNYHSTDQSSHPDGNSPLGPPFDFAATSTNNAAPAPVNHDDEATPPPVSDHITIGLTTGNGDGEMTFKVKRSIKMKRIMDQYAERSGRSRPALRFLFEGTRIQDQDTPEDLEMEDGDSIDVHQEQIGGTGRKPSSFVVLDEAAAPPVNHMMIGLQVDDKVKMFFKLKPATRMKRVKNEYAKSSGRDIDELVFIFDGSRVRDIDTPESMSMEDGDIMEVHQKTGLYLRAPCSLVIE